MRLGRVEELLRRLCVAVEQGAAARAADDDGWTRLPRPSGRCPQSGWSRSTVERKIKTGEVRAKTVGGCRYYAASDVLRLLKQAEESLVKSH